MDQKLKSKLFPRLNAALKTFGGYQSGTMGHKKQIGLNPELVQFEHELKNLGKLKLEKRRESLRRQLILDYYEEDKNLRKVDIAYINTQP